jgi:hypothetical protein
MEDSTPFRPCLPEGQFGEGETAFTQAVSARSLQLALKMPNLKAQSL